MDEAQKRFFFFFRRRPKIRSERGQAILEFLLILLVSLAFLQLVFFNKEFGFKASLDKTMLRLGSYLEANLKSGTKLGPDGVKSMDGFAGVSRWSN